MKRLLLWSGALALGALLLSGCASVRHPQPTPQPRKFALAVTVYGSLQPTPAQWAVVQAAARRELAAVGWVLVNDLAEADQIIRVDFTPDPVDPEHAGRAVVIEFRDNPLRALTTIQPAAARSYTYTGTASRSLYGYHDYPYSIYSSYSDGYTYDEPSGTVTPVPPSRVTPPPKPPSPSGRHTDRADRDPDTRRTGISRHGGSETRRRDDGDGGRRHEPPPSYSRSDSGHSGGSGSSSSSSYSSGSSSSYSSSSYSSSSDSGSSSSSSGGSSSGSSSSGSYAEQRSEVLR